MFVFLCFISLTAVAQEDSDSPRDDGYDFGAVPIEGTGRSDESALAPAPTHDVPPAMATTRSDWLTSMHVNQGLSLDELLSQVTAQWESGLGNLTRQQACAQIEVPAGLSATTAVAQLGHQGCLLEDAGVDALLTVEGWGALGDLFRRRGDLVLAADAYQLWLDGRVRRHGWDPTWLEEPTAAFVAVALRVGRVDEARAVARQLVEAVLSPMASVNLQGGLATPLSDQAARPAEWPLLMASIRADTFTSIQSNAMLQAAQVERLAGNPQAAAELLVKLGVNSPEAIFELSLSMLALGRADTAAQSLGHLAQLDSIDDKLRASVHHHLGQAHHALGQYDQARNAYQRSIDAKLTLGPATTLSIAATRHQLGWLHEDLGQFDDAEANYQAALVDDAAARVRDPIGRAATLNNLGWLHEQWGHIDQAGLDYEAAADALASLPPDLPAVQQVWIDLSHGQGFLAMRRGDSALAVAQLQAALDRSRALVGAEHPQDAMLAAGLGRALSMDGQDDAAWTVLQGALAAAALVQAPAIRWEALDAAAAHLQRTGQIQQATFWSQQAVVELQAVRSTMGAAPQAGAAQGFVGRHEDIYRRLIALLIEGNRLAEAEAVLGLLKQQELERFQRDTVLTDASVPRQRREQTLARRLAMDRDQIVARAREFESLRAVNDPSDDEVARMEELRQLRIKANRRFTRTLDQIAAAFVDDSAARNQQVGARDLDALRGLQSELDAHGKRAVLLSMVVAPDGVHLLVTTPEARVAEFVAIDRTLLNEKILMLRDALLSPTQDPRPRALEMFDTVIGPVWDHIDAAQPDVLLLSLDQNLRYLPIAALYDGNSWLAESWPIAIITPAGKEFIGRELTAPPTVVALGVSQPSRIGEQQFSALSKVPAELAAVTASVPGASYLDSAFDEQHLSDALLGDAPWVHIASHFHFDPGTYDQSYLVLGDNQRLTVADLVDRDFDFPLDGLDLLALSACQTAMGTVGADGSEVEGLAAVAQQGRAWSVLATLWPVADASTAAWMGKMYGLRVNNGLTKAEAVQQTQLAMLRGELTGSTDRDERAERLGGTETDKAPPGLEGWKHPYHWAPFVLMGAW